MTKIWPHSKYIDDHSRTKNTTSVFESGERRLLRRAKCPAGKRGESSSTMSADATPPTRCELIEMHAQIEQLRLDMAARSAGGKQASGRYKKHDTARKVFLETVAIPSLRLGKRVGAADWRRLFLPGDDEIGGTDKIDMDKWSQLHKVDPRSKSNESYQLDDAKQLTLLQWVARNADKYVPPQPAPSGAPRDHRLTVRENKTYAGFTLRQLAVDGNRKQLVHGARVPASATLLFIASVRYAWRFPEHVPLFIALSALDRAGCTTMTTHGRVAITATHARTAYASYAQKDLAPRDDDEDVLASASTASSTADLLISCWHDCVQLMAAVLLASSDGLERCLQHSSRLQCQQCCQWRRWLQLTACSRRLYCTHSAQLHRRHHQSRNEVQRHKSGATKQSVRNVVKLVRQGKQQGAPSSGHGTVNANIKNTLDIHIK